MFQNFKNVFYKLYAALLFTLAFVGTKASAASDVESGLNKIRSPFSSSGWLTGADSVPELIEGAIRLMLFVAGAIAVLFVVIGGYYYISAQGNEEQAEKGKQTIVNSLIGVVVIILAWVIVNVVVDFVSR